MKIEIDDPNLSVKFDGSTITVDNDNQPIKISATKNRTLEVLYKNGTSIESFTKELDLKKGDTRVVKVTLLDGGVVIDGQPVVANQSEDQKRVSSPTTHLFGGDSAGEERELVPGIRFHWCPPGRFIMGSRGDENGRDPDEDQVPVVLYSGFWLGETAASCSAGGSSPCSAWKAKSRPLKLSRSAFSVR